MLSGLPQLLGKNFIIGHLLPATLFMLLLSAMLAAFDIQLPALFIPRADNLAELIKLIESSFFVILLSVVLLAFGQRLEWLLQGYSEPIKSLGTASARSKFENEIEPVLAEMRRIDRAQKIAQDPGAPTVTDFPRKLYEAVRNYPDSKEWVLPTRFGNIMRAAEVYPRVVYGLDGVPSWPHLLMLVPKAVDEQLKDRRSIIDFLMNTFVLSLVLAATYLSLAILRCSLEAPWIPVGLLVAVTLTWVFLPAAAREWSYAVKAVYDLYRPELAKKLGFKLPPTAEAEYVFWQNVSAMMIYRSHEGLRLNNTWRLPGGGDRPSGSDQKDK